MAAVEVDRLTIDAPGLAPEQGRRLGELVASKLSSARWLPSGATVSAPITVARRNGTDIDGLAALIVDELRRRLS